MLYPLSYERRRDEQSMTLKPSSVPIWGWRQFRLACVETEAILPIRLTLSGLCACQPP